MPRVSIMLTSYNHGPFLAEAIESILNQTFDDFELYILDDCSTDNSWDIVQKYASRDSRIVAERAEVNGKLGRLRRLLPVFSGEYVAIAHSDDVWDLTKLEKQVSYLDAHPETGGCFSRVRVIDDCGNEIPNHPCVQAFSPANRNRFEWLHYFFFHGNALCHPSALIRKASYETYPLLARGLSGLPDFYKWIQLCLHEDIYILEEPLIFFRIHGDGSNESAQTVEAEKRVQIEWVLVLREFLQIGSEEDFLKVFPEANNYVVNGEICIPFALAQICLNNTSSEPHHLFAIQVLYDLFQDDFQRTFIDKVYGYSDKQFTQDKKRYDYLGNLASSKTTTAVLYYDNGHGISDAYSLKQEKMLVDSGQVTYEWDLSQIEGEISFLRFDPVDGIPCSCRVVLATLGSNSIELKAVNAFKQDEWDDFASSDPQYQIGISNVRQDCVVRIVLEFRVWDLTRYLRIKKNLLFNLLVKRNTLS